MCTSRRRNLSVSVRGLMYQCLREIFVSGRGTSVGERYLSIYVGFCDARMYALTSLCVSLSVLSWVLVCSIGRPSSARVLCPHEIGRDSWDRGGQDSVEQPDLNSPPRIWGKKPSLKVVPLRGETERPLDEVIIVVECCCFLINTIMVEPP